MAFIRYTTLRLAMLLLIGGICYLIGLRGLVLAIVAFLASGIVSLFVLDRQRDAMGESLGGFFKAINARIDADSRKEDVD
jgi:hypothetical protein